MKSNRQYVVQDKVSPILYVHSVSITRTETLVKWRKKLMAAPMDKKLAILVCAIVSDGCIVAHAVPA